MTDRGPILPARRPAESFAFLEGPQPIFEGQNVESLRGLVIDKVNGAFLQNLEQKGIGGVATLARDCAVCVHCVGTDSLIDLLRPAAFHCALILATDVRSRQNSNIIREFDARGITATSPVPGQGTLLWGHFQVELSLADIKAAEQLLPRVEPLQVTEKFNRVGNALLFYQNGYNSDNPDLSLISFATCLESLFSTMEQELSFRLSLRVATFLADENAARRELFEESKEVYRVRSKVVHGAHVHKNSETAAIYLVEHIVPQAERLARRCLAKVLELQIEAIFENAAKLNTLFDKLLFSNSLRNALEEIR